jgi:hypothetical protein
MTKKEYEEKTFDWQSGGRGKSISTRRVAMYNGSATHEVRDKRLRMRRMISDIPSVKFSIGAVFVSLSLSACLSLSLFLFCFSP